MGEKYWISDEEIKVLLNYAHLENETEIKKIFEKIKKNQKINKENK